MKQHKTDISVDKFRKGKKINFFSGNLGLKTTEWENTENGTPNAWIEIEWIANSKKKKHKKSNRPTEFSRIPNLRVIGFF